MGSAGGAILELFANGANSSSQTLVLAQGTTSTGKAFWSGDVTKGFKGHGAPGAGLRCRPARAITRTGSARIKLSRWPRPRARGSCYPLAGDRPLQSDMLTGAHDEAWWNHDALG